MRYRDKALGWSQWSNPVSFKTDSVFQNWKIYPNPVVNHTALNIPLSENEHLKIRIFSSNGKLVGEYGHVHPPVFYFSRNKLRKGAYYLQVLKQNELLKTIKFIVVDSN